MTTKKKKIIVKALILGFLTMKLSEQEDMVVWDMISDLVPDPEFSDYVFHSSEFYHGKELDVEKVVEKGFDYKPIAL